MEAIIALEQPKQLIYTMNTGRAPWILHIKQRILGSSHHPEPIRTRELTATKKNMRIDGGEWQLTCGGRMQSAADVPLSFCSRRGSRLRTD